MSAPIESASELTFAEGVWRVGVDRRRVAIHSRDPAREADQQAATLCGDGKNPTLIVAVGLGLGYLLDALERRDWQGKVLAFEPEPATITPMRERRDWSGWMNTGRLRVLAGPDYVGAADSFGFFGDGSTDPGIFVNHALGQWRPSETEHALATARRLQREAQLNAQARRALGARYLLNTLGNINALSREGDVASLAGAGTGLSAIVLGAGPSLDRALPALRAAQSTAIIIAVDTALRPLLAAGIRPHLAVAVDPGDANTRHLYDLPPCPETFLVSEASVDPRAVREFRGRTFLFCVADHHPWPWLRAQGAGRGRLRAWGSVLTSAFDLALLMECDPIVFAGADLAFTDNRPYCRGVVYEEDWRRLKEWGVPLETQWKTQITRGPLVDETDVCGRPVRTAAHLLAFRNWLAEQTVRESHRRFINATGAGILSGRAIEQRSLDSVVEAFDRVTKDPRDVVRACYRPAPAPSLCTAIDALLSGASAADDDPVATWQQFADGLTRENIVDSLSKGVNSAAAPQETTRLDGPPPSPAFDAWWIEPLAAQTTLVRMPIPEARMEKVRPGVRLFRFRTTMGRLIACLLRMPEGAVAENGRPLMPGAGTEHLQPGEYYIWRDDVYFTASDGSDPRDNGRSYSLTVPAGVAHLEALALQEILRKGI
jgi:hypothetical protein